MHEILPLWMVLYWDMLRDNYMSTHLLFEYKDQMLVITSTLTANTSLDTQQPKN